MDMEEPMGILSVNEKLSNESVPFACSEAEQGMQDIAVEEKSFPLHFSSSTECISCVETSAASSPLSAPAQPLKSLPFMDPETREQRVVELQNQNQRITRVMVFYSKRVAELEKNMEDLEQKLVVAEECLGHSPPIGLNELDMFLNKDRREDSEVEGLKKKVDDLEQELEGAYGMLASAEPVSLGDVTSKLCDALSPSREGRDKWQQINDLAQTETKTMIADGLSRCLEDLDVEVTVENELQRAIQNDEAENVIRMMVQNELRLHASGVTTPLISSYGTFAASVGSSVGTKLQCVNTCSDAVTQSESPASDCEDNITDTVSDQEISEASAETIKKPNQKDPQLVTESLSPFEEIAFPLATGWYNTKNANVNTSATETSGKSSSSQLNGGIGSQKSMQIRPNRTIFSATSTREDTDQGAHVTTRVTFKHISTNRGTPWVSAITPVVAKACAPHATSDRIETNVDRRMSTEILPRPHRRVLDLQHSLDQTEQQRDMQSELETRRSPRWQKLMACGTGTDTMALGVNCVGAANGSNVKPHTRSPVSESVDISAVGVETFEPIQCSSPPVKSRESRSSVQASESADAHDECTTGEQQTDRSWQDISFVEDGEEKDEERSQEENEAFEVAKLCLEKLEGNHQSTISLSKPGRKTTAGFQILHSKVYSGDCSSPVPAGPVLARP